MINEEYTRMERMQEWLPAVQVILFAIALVLAGVAAGNYLAHNQPLWSIWVAIAVELGLAVAWIRQTNFYVAVLSFLLAAIPTVLTFYFTVMQIARSISF
jgi:hypothetical protein